MKLTSKEFAVLFLMSKGWANKKIAVHLNRSESTIKAHTRTLFLKFGVNSRTSCVLAAQKLNIGNDGRTEELHEIVDELYSKLLDEYSESSEGRKYLRKMKDALNY